MLAFECYPFGNAVTTSWAACDDTDYPKNEKELLRGRQRLPSLPAVPALPAKMYSHRADTCGPVIALPQSPGSDTNSAWTTTKTVSKDLYTITKAVLGFEKDPVPLFMLPFKHKLMPTSNDPAYTVDQASPPHRRLRPRRRRGRHRTDPHGTWGIWSRPAGGWRTRGRGSRGGRYRGKTAGQPANRKAGTGGPRVRPGVNCRRG